MAWSYWWGQRTAHAAVRRPTEAENRRFVQPPDRPPAQPFINVLLLPALRPLPSTPRPPPACSHRGCAKPAAMVTSTATITHRFDAAVVQLGAYARHGRTRAAPTAAHLKNILPLSHRRMLTDIALRHLGAEILMLAAFRVAWPHAQADEVIAFLFAQTGTLYSRWDITRAENRIGMTRKRGSITAEQALSPANLHRRHCFFNMPYPVGIVGASRAGIVDFDECGVYKGDTNRSMGKAGRGVRCAPPLLLP